MSTTPNHDQDKDKTLFLHLIMMMSASAMQNMGKTVNPLTGKPNVDLDGAAFAIDMLAMIEARTAGNRSPDEDRLLKTQLATLRLNFVETTADQTSKTPDSQGAAGESTDSKAQQAQAEPPTDSAAQQAQSSPPAAEPKEEARFHKSYG